MVGLAAVLQGASLRALLASASRDAGPGDHVNLNLTRDPVAPVAPGINVEPRAFQCHAAAGCASVPCRDY